MTKTEMLEILRGKVLTESPEEIQSRLNEIADELEQSERVVHGHWIKHNEGNPMFLYGECSVCNFEQSVSHYLKYCPDCGAKMFGGSDEK